jgi:hypothetical protein
MHAITSLCMFNVFFGATKGLASVLQQSVMMPTAEMDIGWWSCDGGRVGP